MTQPADPPAAPIVVQLVDARMLAQCRQVIEAILLCLRASRYQRAVSPAIVEKVHHLPRETYNWHWLAWRMQGFRRGSQLGYTDDGQVYVYRDGVAWVGDPKTDNVVQFAGAQPPPAMPPTYVAPEMTFPAAAIDLERVDSASDLIH